MKSDTLFVVLCFLILLGILASLSFLLNAAIRKRRESSLRLQNLIITCQQLTRCIPEVRQVILIDFGCGREFWACFSDAPDIDTNAKLVRGAKLIHPPPDKSLLSQLDSTGTLKRVEFRH